MSLQPIAPATLHRIYAIPNSHGLVRHVHQSPGTGARKARALSLEAALTIAFLLGMLASLVVLITMAWFVGALS